MRLFNLFTIMVLAVGLACGVDSDQGETVVRMDIVEMLGMSVPMAFDFGTFVPGETATHEGFLQIMANIDWVLEVEDNSNYFIIPYGPGNGHMTLHPYDPSDPNPVQLQDSMKITTEGQTVDFEDAQIGSPKPIIYGGPGDYSGANLKKCVFNQKIEWGDRQGSYMFVVTFFLNPDI